MARKARQYEQEIEDLRARLQEAEETLEAIRSGQVDAIVVEQGEQERIFTLQGAETAYRTILEKMNEGAVMLAADGTIVYCNARFAEVLGKPLDQVLGGAIEPFVLAEDLPILQALLQQAARGDSRGEVRFRDSRGAAIALYLSLNRLPLDQAASVCMVATDLTQQKRHEQVLAAEQLARSILEQAAEPMVVCDRDGTIIRASHAARELCGCSPILQPLPAAFPLRAAERQDLLVESAGGTGRFLLKEIASGKTVLGQEMVLQRDGGRTVNVLVSGRPLLGRGNEILGSVISLVDISERKQTERQLQELNETLERRVADRTAEVEKRVDQLRAMTTELTLAEHRERQRLAKVLHDHLQQLLVGARFNVAIAQGQIDEPQVRRSLDHVNELLDESMQASRSLTAELFPPVLREGTFAEALRWLVRWMQDKHGLQVHLKADEQAEPPAEDVRLLLFEAVRELLFNVVKHAGVREARLEVARHDQRQVRIRIADAGRGFDPASVHAADRADGGFGLPAIRQRLQLLGGRVEIESKPGEGTRATLFAPLGT